MHAVVTGSTFATLLQIWTTPTTALAVGIISRHSWTVKVQQNFDLCTILWANFKKMAESLRCSCDVMMRSPVAALEITRFKELLYSVWIQRSRTKADEGKRNDSSCTRTKLAASHYWGRELEAMLPNVLCYFIVLCRLSLTLVGPRWLSLWSYELGGQKRRLSPKRGFGRLLVSSVYPPRFYFEFGLPMGFDSSED
jgi:hypothetical protein